MNNRLTRATRFIVESLQISQRLTQVIDQAIIYDGRIAFRARGPCLIGREESGNYRTVLIIAKERFKVPAMKTVGVILVVLLVLQNMIGCAPAKKSTSSPSAKLRRAAYERVDRVFQKAVFYKPAEDTVTQKYSKLAPLIVQAVPDAAAAGPLPGRIAAIKADPSSKPFFNISRPTIYTDVSRATLDGRDYEQVVYVWWYSPNTTEMSSARIDDSSSPWRGYRLTLDSEGFPIIWEVLGNESGLAVIFVSKTLEEAAKKTFGLPLDERRFSIEQSVKARPNVVVARILDDGPQPMGPFVYLSAEYQTVTTLICRCMPSQVHDFVDNISYELQPLARLGELGSSGLVWPASALDLPHPHPEMSDPAWLEQALRLPDAF